MAQAIKSLVQARWLNIEMTFAHDIGPDRPCWITYDLFIQLNDGALQSKSTAHECKGQCGCQDSGVVTASWRSSMKF